MKSYQRNVTEDLGSVVVVTFDMATGKIALVYEEAKGREGRSVYWKCPGGMVEEKDRDGRHPGDPDLMAENAASREILEETGIALDVVFLLDVEKKVSRNGGLHLKRIYAGVGSFGTLKFRGDEGEIVRAFALHEARALSNFFELHRGYLNLAEEKIRALA